MNYNRIKNLVKPFLGITKILIISCLFIDLVSCRTNKVPEGKHLLTKNTFKFVDANRPFFWEVRVYPKQKPNAKILAVIPKSLWLRDFANKQFDEVLNTYFRLEDEKRNQKNLDSLYVLYNMANKKGKGIWLNKFLYNLGEDPVLVDTISSLKSADNLQKFYQSKGYFDVKVNVSHKFNVKKCTVTYIINAGKPSLISNYTVDISDPKLLKLYNDNIKYSNIDNGKPFDFNELTKERERLIELYKNHGYYKFDDARDKISFVADSTITNKMINLKLVIKANTKDTIDNFKPHYFKEINVYTDLDVKDTDNKNNLIKIEHKNYNLYTKNQPAFTPRLLTDALVIEKNRLYNLTDISNTKRNISNLQNFEVSNFEIKSENDSMVVANIWLRTKKKYDLDLSFDGTYSQYLNLGFSPGINLVDRNVFGGGENLNTFLKGTIGSVKNIPGNDKIFNAWEVAFQTKLLFPRFALLFNTEDLIPKRWNPTSSISLGINAQQNIGLGRVNFSFLNNLTITPSPVEQHNMEIFSTQFIKTLDKERYYDVFRGDYNIRNNAFNEYKAYTTTFDTTLNYLEEENKSTKILYDTNFRDQLTDQSSYLKFKTMYDRKERITQDALINSLSYTYTINQNLLKNYTNPFYLKIRAELSGLLFSLLDKMLNFKQVDNKFKSSAVFGVPYSQYYKIDLDIRKTWQLFRKSNITTRLFLGYIHPYGNSDNVPFEKSYFAGGTNDIRAWKTYSLNPVVAGYDGDGLSIDDFKLTMNLEYRFPIAKTIEGALFTDAGNIWGTTLADYTQFKFNTFYKQLGVGSGLGLRYNLTFLILRIDLAYKIYDPSYIQKDRFRIMKLNIFNPTFNFGINYPF